MKKFYEIGAKTGLSAQEIHKVARFGMFGLIAAVLAALSGCFKNNKPAVEAPRPAPRSPAEIDPAALRDLVDSLDKSTGTVKPQAGDNCGPYPGYPCGTRYYTVSVSDFFDKGLN